MQFALMHRSPSVSEDKVSGIIIVSPLTPNDFLRCRAVIPLKIKIPIKPMKNQHNATIIHSVY
jgi:hypothetical protein